jgi:hypothetical protein
MSLSFDRKIQDKPLLHSTKKKTKKLLRKGLNLETDLKNPKSSQNYLKHACTDLPKILRT